MTWEQFWLSVKNWLMTTGIRVLISVVILLVSFYIINKISKAIARKSRNLESHGKVDKTIYRALSHITRIVLKVLVVVAIVGYLGFDTSGISALIASLGVGIGLAVNGALSNFAGGVLLLITRPFKVDDYIETCGYSGTVEDIFICNTKIITPDGKKVYLPNGKLSTSEIVNYTENGLRRVDFDFSIAYNADFDKACELIKEIADNEPLVLKLPAGMVRMSAHGNSAIVIAAKFWCKTADYWTVYFNVLEAVKKAFDANGIEIPFNQLDVHVKNS